MQAGKGDTDIWDTVGEGEGGRNGRNSTETYILPRVKQTASGGSVQMQGAQSQCSVTASRGGVGRRVLKREGTSIYLMLIHADIWQKLLPYCKVIIF